jgi:signal transduction histidine kinase
MRATDDSERTQHVDVAAMLGSAVRAIREGYPNATVSLSSCPQATVMANDLLDSVFENLLKNAVVHNDTGHPTIDVSLSVTDDTATVHVSDDGPGIPDDKKGQLFSEGERGVESRGMGLGLYLVRTIVSNFKGDVWVEDNDPRGATFVVELPRIAAAEPSDAGVYETE